MFFLKLFLVAIIDVNISLFLRKMYLWSKMFTDISRET